MDWDRVEQDAYFQTQQVLVSISGSREEVVKSVNWNPYHDVSTKRDVPLPDSRSRDSRRVSYSHEEDPSIEGYVQDLRNVSMVQSKKVLSIENVLNSYSEVMETSSVAQASLEMRVDGLEQNLRGSNKFVSETHKERSALSILMKSMSSKIASLEDSMQSNEHCYATKEAFSQLLDSTVDEIKSVGVAVSQASVKSQQSVSLIEALILAIHRMRGSTDAFSTDEDSVGRSLSFEFLSSLTGERQREQVVRLLRESLHCSVTSVAKDVVSREAESICNSVNGMLRTLNGQLMMSVEEVGRQTKATCTAAHNKATQCLAITNRLDGQQADLSRSLETHIGSTRDQVAQQFRVSMESLGVVLEDIASVQRTVKGDLRSFESELAEQRKTLYLEVGHQKEMMTSLQGTCSSIERNHDADNNTLDKRILDVVADVRALKAKVKAGDEEKEGVMTSSELSKEVITALVTEVILADAIDKRSREAVDGATALSKQHELLATMSEEAEGRMEGRMAGQIEALKVSFKAEMASMAREIESRETEAERVKTERVEEDDEWQTRLEEEVDEMRRAATDQEEAQAAVINRLRVDLEKKTEEIAVQMAAANEREVASKAEVAALQQTLELFMKSHSEGQDREREEKDSEAKAESAATISLLQEEVTKVGGKVSDAQTALAKMHVKSMYMQDEIKAANDGAKEARGLVSELAVSMEKLEQREVTPPPSLSQQVSGEQFKRLEDRMDAAIVSVTASLSAVKREGQASSETTSQIVAAFHSQFKEELQTLRQAIPVAGTGGAGGGGRASDASLSLTSEELSRIEFSLSALEEGLDVLHGVVVQQGQQSTLLEARLLETEEKVDKMQTPGIQTGSHTHTVIDQGLHTEPAPVTSQTAKSSPAHTPGTAQGTAQGAAQGPPKKEGEAERGTAHTAYGQKDQVKTPPSAIPTPSPAAIPATTSHDSIPTTLSKSDHLCPITAPHTGSIATLNSSSSSMTNSLASSRNASANILAHLEVGNNFDSESNSVQTTSRTNTPSGTPTGTPPRDNRSGDSSDMGSPLSIPVPIPSPPGTAVRRRFHDATAAAACASDDHSDGEGDKHIPPQGTGSKIPSNTGSSAQGREEHSKEQDKHNQKQKKELPQVDMSDIYEHREDVMKQLSSRGSPDRKKLAEGKATQLNNQKLPSLSKSNSQNNLQSHLQSNLSDPNRRNQSPSSAQSDDDDFSIADAEDEDENSMSASSELDIYNGRGQVSQVSNSPKGVSGVSVPAKLFPHEQHGQGIEDSMDGSVDMSSSFDTSPEKEKAQALQSNQSKGPLYMKKFQHFDPQDLSRNSTPESSPSAQSTPRSQTSLKREPLAPLAPIGSKTAISAPLATTISAAQAGKAVDSKGKDNFLLKSPAATTAAAAMPLYGSVSIPTATGRSPQPVLSGSLLSSGRRSVPPAVTPAVAPVHIPVPSKTTEVPQRNQTSTGNTQGSRVEVKEEPPKYDKDDDDSNLDFDASSWDEEDEAEESG